MIDPSDLRGRARAAAPDCDGWTVRCVVESSERLTARQGVAQAPSRSRERGAMVSVAIDGGLAHAATADIGDSGLRDAFARARDLARQAAPHMLFDPRALARAPADRRGAATYDGPGVGAASADLATRIDLVMRACASLAIDARIVDWHASLSTTDAAHWYLDGDGRESMQRFRFTVPNLTAVACEGSGAEAITQTRTLGGQYNGFCQQGDDEVVARSGFLTEGARVASEAIELALAPNCPSGTMDVVLMPDQMMLQIHESIGHPLELDRILGDERNFAGTSFVTPSMFGHYRYGSELLTVTHDPSDRAGYASFGFDDEGTPSAKVLLIDKGILMRPLGGALSIARSAREAPALPASARTAIATTRACSWNRAPIDRMSNLNIEPGNSSLDAMIAATRLGVLMRTNCSWSIDDSRNKFQFGCEHGRMIRDGRLAEVVRNPNYRGVSATFWRSLAMVGDLDTVRTLGTPYCGKGEPMQVIRVGHASPACRFTNVDVFGAAR
ncbi:MAG: TldD/PmbA family protein [Lautropia sp.]